MRLKYAALLLLMLSVLYGCTHMHYVNVSYMAETPNDKPGGGQEVYVKKALDSRPDTSLLGRQKMGVHTHLVVLENGLDLTKIVTCGVSDSLSAYGYLVKNADGGIPAGSKELHTTIREFHSLFSPGFVTVDTNSDIELEFELKVHGMDRVLWKKNIVATATASSAWGLTDGLYEKSLNRCFKDTLEDFQHSITAADFRNALMEK